jgi:hypothetical protein
MSERRILFLRNGLVAGCAFAALLMLASFYSIVSGAVDRAARHRLAGVDVGSLAAPPAALAATSSRRVTLVSRADN